MNTFTVNGVVYTAKPFGFNMVCDLDDMGVSIAEAGKKPMSMVRAYFALCAGVSLEDAGTMLENHVVNGGGIDSVVDAMSKEMNESGFFQNLNKRAEQATPKTTRKKRETTDL